MLGGCSLVFVGFSLVFERVFFKRPLFLHEIEGRISCKGYFGYVFTKR